MVVYMNGNYSGSQAFITNETRSLLFKLLQIAKLYWAKHYFILIAIPFYYREQVSILQRERETDWKSTSSQGGLLWVTDDQPQWGGWGRCIGLKLFFLLLTSKFCPAGGYEVFAAVTLKSHFKWNPERIFFSHGRIRVNGYRFSSNQSDSLVTITMGWIGKETLWKKDVQVAIFGLTEILRKKKRKKTPMKAKH